MSKLEQRIDAVFCMIILQASVYIIIQLGVGILLGMIFMGVSYGVVEGNLVAGQKSLEVGRNVDTLNRHAVKTIQSEDGDIIDCIDIYKQPAFDHPALKNHTIQMTPSYDPTTETRAETIAAKLGGRKRESSRTVTSQLWQKSGSCPKGTIPVLRIQKKDLLKSNSVGEYGRKKQPGFTNELTLGNDSENSYLQQANHSKAVLLTEGFNYLGGKGDIQVFNPYVESDDEYSTSQVCLKHGPYYAFESVESGWAADASKTTGCFDLTCPGFIQTSSEIALGAAIYPISVPRGLPYQITIYIYKDPYTNNWWVQYGGKINIGYWPHKLFKMLSYGAEAVEWGGEVYSSKIGNSPPPHTATAMGSGKFPGPIFGSGCVRRMRVRENTAPLKFLSGFLLMQTSLIVFSNGVYGMSKERKASMEMEIDRKLKLLNKPAVKSIQSEDGDIIDCVDIHKQPALDHPALKKHIIQMAPKYVPEGVSPAMKKESSKTGGSEVKQIWQRSGSCPEGTIPIRRIQKKDLLRAASLQHFGRKPPSHPLQENTIKPDKSLGPNGTDVPVGPETNRSKAVLLSYEYQFLGASGAINVWKPTVDLPDDYSSGQIWLKSGNLSNYDSVESGWVVYPALYGNDQPRSFIHWTSDAYHTTGCFDLTCAGFVQTNNKISFGTALDPVSVASGPQYEIGVSIYMDPVTSNWWLDYGSETKVGYWPGTLFETLNFSAIVAEWGGEVYSSRVLNSQANHTTTQMGSGAFPTSLYGIASYVARIRNMDFSLQWKYPGDKETYLKGQGEYKLVAPGASRASGYWTTTLFTSLSHRAEALAWGGKVINSAHMGAHGQHTQTDMGSGHFLTMGNLRASFIRGIQFIDDKFFTRILWFLVPNITNKNCYGENEGEVSADWAGFYTVRVWRVA
ncbi:hypothetical protein CK203_003488 [Vitis vinifera]|uniref:Neprosin PEP catalytic domain-containing protein n=1 Tax=Vitis vinifera TaxID=29760 RepID=A0A438K8L5_VITVI|nr:hypothetical protein CK203_003488 [Vitis vinifera]